MPSWIHSADNVWTTLSEISPEQEKEVYNALKVRQKNYFFDPRFRMGIWDGNEHFYDLVHHRILTGLVPFAAQCGFDFEQETQTQSPYSRTLDTNIQLNGIEEFADYQKLALQSIVEGAHRGIFDHVTGAGKSVLAAMIAKLFAGLKILVIVPTCDLMGQFVKDFEQMLGIQVGKLGCRCAVSEGDVTVAYIGFIRDHIKSPLVRQLYEETEVLMVDELQMVTTKLYPFFKKCNKAHYRFGFSGSFFEGDEVRVLNTMGHFGPTITQVTDRDLMEAGRGVPPEFRFYEYILPKTDSDELYVDVYNKLIAENITFNQYFCNLLHPYFDQGDTILVVVQRINHCTLLQSILRDMCIPTKIFNGRVSLEERKDLREGFKEGKFPVLIATRQTFGVGINIPRIEVLLNLSGGVSSDKSLQLYGRGLRSFEDKKSVTILEPFITGNKWFNRHSKGRMKVAKSYTTGKVWLHKHGFNTAVLV